MSHVRIIHADVLAGLRQQPDESVQCVVTSLLCANFVQRLRFFIQAFHAIGELLWPRCCASMTSPECDLCLDAGSLNFPQSKAVSGLLNFYTKKWQKCRYASQCALIGRRPRIQWPAVFCAWFRHVKTSPKCLFQHLRDLWCYLSQRNALTENWRARVFTYAHCISASLDSYCAIAINGASKIGKSFCFHATP